MRNNKFLWGLGLIGVLIFLVVTSAIISSPRVAIFAQRKMGLPGDNFVIGDAKFLTQPNWLLTSYKKQAGDQPRVYGLLPVPDAWAKNMLPGRYFAFTDVSGSARIGFAFTEIEPAFNEMLKGWLSGTLVPGKGLDRCHIEKDVTVGLSGIQCTNAGGWIMYIPDIGVRLIMDSNDPNFRSHLKLAGS